MLMILIKNKSARVSTLEFVTISLNEFLRVILTLLILKKAALGTNEFDYAKLVMCRGI